jgi:serine protease AprX
MRIEVGTKGESRSSALWGKRSGSRGNSARSSKGRGFATFLVLVVAVAGPLASTGYGAKQKDYKAYVTPTLLTAAKSHPKKTFSVIVQGDGTTSSAGVGNAVAAGVAQSMGRGRMYAALFSKNRISNKFRSINGVGAKLTGRQILKLADRNHIVAITLDAPVELSGSYFDDDYSNRQKWPAAADVRKLWRYTDNLDMPAIAIVDSGIDSNRSDFAYGQIVAKKTMTALQPNSPGDGRGHGTFVAGIAAGVGRNYAGAAPGAPIVSIDVMNDKGMAMTSDVIASADWILQNKARYNIRVANFSLHSAVPNSFMYDPLSKAVERLWFGGVVVVAASGNYGVDGEPSGVYYAPGNDPFVITVGAMDIGSSWTSSDDAAAPWSAYGYTLDGFAKPELSAPGRYMVGPVPMSSTLVSERPEQIRGNGYMELSGTSFAAPVVAGISAYLLGLHPNWTPDQVKGALMLTASNAPNARALSVGVGEVDGDGAAKLTGTPPNPNLALNSFVVADPAGGPIPVFDAASWANLASSDASWANASWANASWANASWANASWANASWANASWAAASWAAASWASASWANASWAAASWAAASWASNSYEDGAEGEDGVGGLFLTDEEIAALAADESEPDPTTP